MKKIQISILSVAIISVAFLATPVFAISTTLGATSGANASSTKAAKVAEALSKRIQTAQARATQEIDRRVSALGGLTTKVSAMIRITSDEKTNISNYLTEQVSALAALKNKLLSDADIAVLKTDIKSITNSYRVFMLVLPQANVFVTTDSLSEAGKILSTLGTKLQTRITEAETAGNNVSSMKTLLSDFNAKLADAEAKIQAAIALVTPLKPDQGDTATISSNKTAFTTARADIKAARADLAAARSDAGKIVKALLDMKTTKTSAEATTTSAN